MSHFTFVLQQSPRYRDNDDTEIEIYAGDATCVTGPTIDILSIQLSIYRPVQIPPALTHFILILFTFIILI